MENKMKKYDYTYGMERPVYTIYTLVDPKYKDIPRYIGFTDGDVVWRLGRHLGETWGKDSMNKENLKQKWIRGLRSHNRIPKSIVLYQTVDWDDGILAESVLINLLWKGTTNTVQLSDKLYKKRLRTKTGRLVVKLLNEKFKNIDYKYKGINLENIYPGILK
jgi:hypothetical protein